jgi:hypothetical protein
MNIVIGYGMNYLRIKDGVVHILKVLTMKRNNMKTDYERTIKRNEQKEAGLFDGRFKARVVPNKKRKAQKEWARKK